MSGRKGRTVTTDEAAEAFLEQDLSDLHFRQFRPLSFEAELKTARVNMRLPEPLLRAVKARAAERGVPYQRLIREAIERAVRAGDDLLIIQMPRTGGVKSAPPRPPSGRR